MILKSEAVPKPVGFWTDSSYLFDGCLSDCAGSVAGYEWYGFNIVHIEFDSGRLSGFINEA
jgi:hypothetical protein